MAEPARKLQMKTTTFEFEGKPVTVGILRKFNDHERILLLETPGVVKATNAEYGTSLRQIDLRILDYLLKRTNNWREVREVFPCPAGAGLAYEKPGTKLGREIVFAKEGEPRVIIATGKYKGEKGIALVAPGLTAGDIQKDGKDILLAVPDSRLVAVPNFPSGDGWFILHAETGLPHGRRTEGFLPEARCLWRLDSSYVGLPVRGNGVGGDYGMYVDADCRPSDSLGVAVEVPEEDAAKIEAPSSKNK